MDRQPREAGAAGNGIGISSTPVDSVVSSAWSRPEALVELIDELREDGGYKIGADEYIAAQDLVLALIARGENLDEPGRL